MPVTGAGGAALGTMGRYGQEVARGIGADVLAKVMGPRAQLEAAAPGAAAGLQRQWTTGLGELVRQAIASGLTIEEIQQRAAQLRDQFKLYQQKMAAGLVLEPFKRMGGQRSVGGTPYFEGPVGGWQGLAGLPESSWAGMGGLFGTLSDYLKGWGKEKSTMDPSAFHDWRNLV